MLGEGMGLFSFARKLVSLCGQTLWPQTCCPGQDTGHRELWAMGSEANPVAPGRQGTDIHTPWVRAARCFPSPASSLAVLGDVLMSPKKQVSLQARGRCRHGPRHPPGLFLLL